MSVERVDLLVRRLDVEIEPPKSFVDQTYRVLAPLAARRRSRLGGVAGGLASLRDLFGVNRPLTVAQLVVIGALLALLLILLGAIAGGIKPPPLPPTPPPLVVAPPIVTPPPSASPVATELAAGPPAILVTTYGGDALTTTTFRIDDVSNPLPVPLEGVHFRRPNQSPNGAFISYWGDARGVFDVVEIDTGKVHEYRTTLDVAPPLSWGPVSHAWSADSRWVAFQFDAHDRGCDTEIMDTESWQITKVTDECLGIAQPSSDGRYLAFDKSNGNVNWLPGRLLDRQSGNYSDLGGRPVSWSPVANWLLLQRRTDLEILDAEGGLARAIQDPCSGGENSWSPDGQQLMCEADPATGIWLLPSDGRPGLQIAPKRAQNGALSPAGDLVLYAIPADEGGYELWVVWADGSNRRRLVADTNGGGAWAPDGSYIAFTRPTTPHTGDNLVDVYVIKPDGSGEQLVASGYYGFAWATH